MRPDTDNINVSVMSGLAVAEVLHLCISHRAVLQPQGSGIPKKAALFYCGIGWFHIYKYGYKII